MKPNLSILLVAAALVLAGASAKAQSLSQYVVATAGNEMLTPDLAFSYTIGEPCVTTWLSQTPIITEGFQQNTVTITSVTETPFARNISVYPNPFTATFTVDFNSRSTKPLLLVTDAIGKTVDAYIQYQDDHIMVDMQNMPSGVYVLTVLQQNETVATYQVIKTNL